ncbi:hypothetical protein O6H91_16G014900 [Diphasiastrum complanatum]|nr:hypothetical protein O6H91_16G014900 [Diphasiastrum complanatum]
MQFPTETGKNRQQFIHDIVKRDKQRLQYFASRIERAKSENSHNQTPKPKGLRVVKVENGGSEEEQTEKTSNS